LVKQALDAQLVKFLLDLLDQPLHEVEHVSSVKAQIVGALKGFLPFFLFFCFFLKNLNQ